MSDTPNIPVTVISEGVRNDLRMCLQQAIECLELGEHDDGWVVCATMDIEMIRELAEAVVCGCDEHLNGDHKA
jgi:hypothetical protein